MARWLVRGLVLAAAVALLLPWNVWPSTPLLPPSLSVYVALGAVIAARSVGLVALLALPVLLVVLVKRRWFCRWMCPTGLLLDVAGGTNPSARSRFVRAPSLGVWIALLTFGGAVVGYPLFAWLDPLALFAGLVHGVGRWPPEPAVVAYALALPAILLLSHFWPNLWCMKLCPLGATQDLLAVRRRPCKKSAEASDEPAPTVARGGWQVGRRGLLALGAGGLAGFFTRRRSRGGEAAALRPPGSVDESRFTGMCVRCGNCVAVCPTRILQPDWGQHGVAGLLAPVVQFDEGYCREDCRRCNQVCPSGAIQRLSLPEKQAAAIGLAVVDMSICLMSDDHECSICRNHCPYEAISAVFSEKEYTMTVVVSAAKCPGCGACEVACPVMPTKAIRVVPCGYQPPTT